MCLLLQVECRKGRTKISVMTLNMYDHQNTSNCTCFVLCVSLLSSGNAIQCIIVTEMYLLEECDRVQAAGTDAL